MAASTQNYLLLQPVWLNNLLQKWNPVWPVSFSCRNECIRTCGKDYMWTVVWENEPVNVLVHIHKITRECAGVRMRIGESVHGNRQENDKNLMFYCYHCSTLKPSANQQSTASCRTMLRWQLETMLELSYTENLSSEGVCDPMKSHAEYFYWINEVREVTDTRVTNNIDIE